MALKAQITGAITEPELRFTPKQQAVLEFRINATPSQRDRTTGQWSDMGSPIWVSVSFWEDDAHAYNDALGKGDRVTVEGTLVQETYQRRDGGEGSKFTLHRPRLLGVIPRRNRASGGAGGSQPQGSYDSAPAYGSPATGTYAQPAHDPWSNAAPSNEAPF